MLVRLNCFSFFFRAFLSYSSEDLEVWKKRYHEVKKEKDSFENVCHTLGMSAFPSFPPPTHSLSPPSLFPPTEQEIEEYRHKLKQKETVLEQLTRDGAETLDNVDSSLDTLKKERDALQTRCAVVVIVIVFYRCSYHTPEHAYRVSQLEVQLAEKEKPLQEAHSPSPSSTTATTTTPAASAVSSQATQKEIEVLQAQLTQSQQLIGMRVVHCCCFLFVVRRDFPPIFL